MSTHNQEFFYKYVSANTTKEILKTGSVRWSSPRIFNDPFDNQFDLHLPFSEKKYTDGLLERIIDHSKNDRSILSQSTTPSGRDVNKAVAILRANPHKYSKEELFKKLYPGLKEVAVEMMADYLKIHADVLKDLCVLCVSETHDNLLLWSHYSSAHEGAVIKFKCLPEYDTALCAAVQVDYKKDMPAWASMDEVLDNNLNGTPLDHRKYLHAMTTTKSEDWSYEKEWRIISSFKTPDEIETGFADYRIVPEEIAEITFGCRMSDNDKVDIAAFAASFCPNAELSQASVHPTRFELEFSPIHMNN